MWCTCVSCVLRDLKKEVTWVTDTDLGDLGDLVSGDLIFKMFIPLRN